MKDELLTVSQAAQFRGVSRTAIYTLISRKRLRRRYSRGNIVVSKAEILALDSAPKLVGRPAGKAMSAQAKANIAAGQRKRWALRKKNSRAEDHEKLTDEETGRE